MATYLQGVQDAVQSLRPPDPQLQFDAQLLATRQAKYDQAHAKLSKMYGTILNSGLTRDDNIAAREEFFKLIESDLQKIAGMDLSKDSNVSKAQNVFKQIYENDFLVKDMVWTKHFNNQLQRAEGFKNCRDPKECGGRYWEDGIKYMQYKREEFKNANQNESLQFANVDYIPHNNLLEEALEKFKELDPEAKKVVPTQDGKYRITYTNGKVIEKPLQDMFGQLYGNDPRFMDMYKVMAYNNRKDEIYASISDGTYDNLNDATVGYIENYRDALQEQFDKRYEEITHDYDSLKTLNEAYAKDLENGKIKQYNSKGELTEEYKLAMQTNELFGKAQQLKDWNDNVKSAQKNLHHQSKREYIVDYMDELNSMAFFEQEVDAAASTLASLTAQEEWEPDEYTLEDYKFQHDLQLQARKFAHEEKLARIKANAKKLEFKDNAFASAETFARLQNEINGTNVYTKAAQSLKDKLGPKATAYIKPNMTETDWENLKASFKGDTPLLDVALQDAQVALINKKAEANSALLKTLAYSEKYGPGIEFENLGVNLNQGQIFYTDAMPVDGKVVEALTDIQAQQLAGWYKQYKGTDDENKKIFADIGVQLAKEGSAYQKYFKTE